MTLRLTVTERLRGRRLVAVAAAAGRARSQTAHVTTRTVLVGSATFTVNAGESRSVTTRLDRLGLALLRRFGRLPVLVEALQRGPRLSQLILRQRLTLKLVKHHRITRRGTR